MTRKPENLISEAAQPSPDQTQPIALDEFSLTQPSRNTYSAETQPQTHTIEPTQLNSRSTPSNTVVLPPAPDMQLLQPVTPVRPATDGVRRAVANTNQDAADGSAITTSIGFGSTVLNVFLQPTQHANLAITGEQGLAVLLLGLIFLMRIANLNYNTLHLDEAIYVTVGQQALAGVFDQGATRWMFGSYFYPMSAAVVDQFGSVIGIRALSAIMSSLSALFVYLTARRLFNQQTGLWALFIFGLMGISINVGQHATYDALSIPLLAASLYCIVAAMTERPREPFYLILASIAFSLSVLAKYIAILMLPALLLLMFALYIYRGRPLFGFLMGMHWVYFLAPMSLLLGLYSLTHFADLYQVLTSQYALQHSERLAIIGTVLQEIGVIIGLALLAVLILAYKVFQRFHQYQPGRLLLLVAAAPALLGSLLAMPLYHFLTANIRSMWKHDVFCLVFLAPLAGYTIAQAIQYVRSLHGRWTIAWRLLGAAVTILGILLFVSTALAENAEYHRNWPNNQNVIAYMRTQNLSPKSRVLASGYAIYEYYFNLGVHNHQVWDNVWYTEYANLTGEPAVEKAIQDCVYDMVVLDDYYAPELNPVLEPILQKAGYAVSYQEVGYGKLETRVFTRQPNQQCRRAA